MRLRYPTSNLCGAGAGGGGRGGSAAARCRLPFLFRCGQSGDRAAPQVQRPSEPPVFRACALLCRAVPCRTAGPAPQASLQAAPRGQRRVSPAAESRKRWSNLVARWQWQSASPARIVMCRKGVGESHGHCVSPCYPDAHETRRLSPRARGGVRGRGGVRCAGAPLFPHSFTPQVALGFSLWGGKMLVKRENCSSVKLNRSCRSERESLSRPAARSMGAGGCSAGAAERRAVRAGPVLLSPPGGRAVSPAGEQLARAPKCTCSRVGKGGEMCAARGGIGAAAGRCTATPPRPAPAPAPAPAAGGEAGAGRGARSELGQDAGGTRPPAATRAQRRPRGESAWPGRSLRARERKGGRRCWGAIASQGSGGGRPNLLGRRSGQLRGLALACPGAWRAGRSGAAAFLCNGPLSLGEVSAAPAIIPLVPVRQSHPARPWARLVACSQENFGGDFFIFL